MIDLRKRLVSPTLVNACIAAIVLGSRATFPPNRAAAGQSPDLQASGSPSVSSEDLAAAGLAPGSTVEVLTWERVYALAVMRHGDVRPAADRNSLQSGVTRAVDDRVKALTGSGFPRLRDYLLDRRREFRDPAPELLNLQRRLERISNAERDVRSHAYVADQFRRRIADEKSGLSQLDLDRQGERFLQARRHLDEEVLAYRDRLDEFKASLGLDPATPIVLDRRGLAAFRTVFEAIDRWFLDTNRRLDDLPRLVSALPAPDEFEVDGIAVLKRLGRDPNGLESILADAVRTAAKARGQDPSRLHVSEVLQIRRRIRGLIDIHSSCREIRPRLVMAVRLKDQAMERILAPPLRPASEGIRQLAEDLAARESELLRLQDRLIDLWASLHSERLALYRELGMLPYASWADYHRDLTAVQGDAEPSGVESGPHVPGEAALSAPAPTAPAPPAPPAPSHPPGD